MIPFETTDSIIEILWDLALAFFVLRLGLIYFTLNALSTAVLLLLQHSSILPPSSSPSSPTTTLPLLALAAALWTRLLVVRYEVPRVGLFRLGIGAVAVGLAGIVGLAGELVVWEVGCEGGVGMGCAEVLGLAVWVGLMPVVQMVGEGRREEVPRMRGMDEEVLEEKAGVRGF
ncbi:hypothetical protein QBC39DRAFT_395816 [Podospora conica]|nr:hypothetical protein QBC39DRAFT_395816 [Schizothecium conicum]